MFSIILPVYNGGKYIDNAIESVFAQTFLDWELIIVNDGSTDNTAEVLEKYESNNKIHIFTKVNEGVSVARNFGVEKSTKDYIVFLDADDIWYKDHLQVMATLITKYPTAGLYGTFTQVTLPNGGQINECHYFQNREDVVYLEDFFEAYYQDKSAKMFTVITTCISRVAFIKAGGFPVGCKIGEDLELSLRVAAYYPVVLTKKITAVYQKELSTATKNVSFDPNWGFFDTVNNLYNDEDIPSSKKENLKKVMQWFLMRRFRHYIIDGERQKALQVYKGTDKRFLSKKDRIINFVLILLPPVIVNKIFALRWRGKA